MVSAPVKLDEALKTFLHFTARWEREIAEGNEEVNSSSVTGTTPPPSLIPIAAFHQAKQTNNNNTNNAEVIDILDEVWHNPLQGGFVCALSIEHLSIDSHFEAHYLLSI